MSLRRSTTRARAQAGGDAAGPRQKRGLADVQQGIKQLHPEPGSDKETDIEYVSLQPYEPLIHDETLTHACSASSLFPVLAPIQ